MYICPMHPEVQSHTAENCPKCGMKLVPQEQAQQHSHHHEEAPSYRPLFLIIGLITVATSALAVRDLVLSEFMWSQVMSNFMAGFFLVFSGFKLLDLKGFAEGYSTYDLLAKKVFRYGYIYPFLELVLGLLYLTGVTPPAVHFATFVLMAFSGVGVALKLKKQEPFQCACLGTFLKIPLTRVTLIEDFGMALMALAMLII